jgi:hypothetical protein
MTIDPSETRLTGKWIFGGTGLKADETCHRIEQLVNGHLVKLGTDWSGWDTLYRDPSDGRLWERIYPQGHLHGGGPPQLQLLTPEEAVKKYGDDTVQR